MLWPLQRFILTFPSEHFCFCSIFIPIWQGEENNSEQRNLKWNPGGALHVASRLNQSSCTVQYGQLSFSGKQLLPLRLISCTTQHNNFFFWVTEGVLKARITLYNINWYRSEVILKQVFFYSCIYSCSCIYILFTVCLWTGFVFEYML